MFRKSLMICSSLAFAVSVAAGDTPPARAKLSAAEIVDKNVAARGGLQAWRAVQTLSLSGKLGAGGNQRATLPVPMPGGRKSGQRTMSATPRAVEEVQLPFVMELARPGKMRFELEFNGQTAVQVYDGANGWKLRPFLGRNVVEAYTPDEMKTASMQADVDGPLVDYAAKGTAIELEGMEKVEDRDTYKVKLTPKNRGALHVWIDAQTFLEAKIEGQPRRLDGADHPVEVYFRDYRLVNGLQIPFVLETRVLPVAKTALGFKDPSVPPEKVLIDKVVVNAKLDESRFAKPQIGVSSNAN
jgi:outer membrane lipoprotein-sorting protein